jgi:hypothetical protein
VGLNRRDVLLLVGIWGVVIVLVAAALIVVGMAQPQAAPAVEAPVATPTLVVVFTPVQVEQTARRQYAQAEAIALGWRTDARLLSCRASWEQTAINLLGRPVEWTFRFYSPQSKRLYFVMVEPGGAVRAIQHVRPVNQPPPVVPLDDWELDSPAALANWLNIGGGAFLGQHPGGTVTAQLSVRAHGQPPQWTVAGYDVNSDESFVATVDAVNGATAIAGVPQ